MKRIICLIVTLLITALFILTSCQTTPPECSTCKNSKSVTCDMCYGRGEGICLHCSYGYGRCWNKDCDRGEVTKYEDCAYCTSGVIVNPITWATINCPECDALGIIAKKTTCNICNGKDICSFCKGSGLAKDCDCDRPNYYCKGIAGQCKDCQGFGKIDCPDCE